MTNQWTEEIERLRKVNGELLEACRGLLDMITDNRLHGDEVYRASDAIKKAEVKT